MKLVTVRLDGDEWYSLLLYKDGPSVSHFRKIKIGESFFKRFQAAEAEWESVQEELDKRVSKMNRRAR